MRSGNTETDILKAPERRRIRRRSAACAINRRAVCRQLANDRQGLGAFLSDGLQLSGGQAEQPQDRGCNLGRLDVIIRTLRFYTRAPDDDRYMPILLGVASMFGNLLDLRRAGVDGTDRGDANQIRYASIVW